MQDSIPLKSTRPITVFARFSEMTESGRERRDSVDPVDASERFERSCFPVSDRLMTAVALWSFVVLEEAVLAADDVLRADREAMMQPSASPRIPAAAEVSDGLMIFMVAGDGLPSWFI